MRKGRRTLLDVLLSVVVASGLIACSGGDASTAPLPPPPPSPPPPPGTGYSIEYATYVGGVDFEEIREPILLAGGRLLFGARTKSGNMPTRPGGFQRSYGGGVGDSYLAIMNANGSDLEAATFFGGSGMERPPYGMALLSDGDIVFTSATTSPNIPTSASSYRRNIYTPIPSNGDGYVCRISGNLATLRWCSYTDGGGPRGGLTVDAQDNVIVTGFIAGPNYTSTPGTLQGDSTTFTLKLNPAGTQAIFAARFGGISAKVLPSGNLSIVGINRSNTFPTTTGAAQEQTSGPPDAFAAEMSADGTRLLYSTLLSGSNIDASEHPHVVFPDGSVLFAGPTHSGDLPGATGGWGGQEDGFVALLNQSGSDFQMVRYLGGSGNDLLLGPAVDAQGNIYVYGNTSSRDIATTADAIQPSYAGGERDGVLFVLSPGATQVVYATYLGGNGDDLIRGVAAGPSGELYLVGRTHSTNFPVTSGALQTSNAGDSDGFVVKLVPKQD